MPRQCAYISVYRCRCRVLGASFQITNVLGDGEDTAVHSFMGPLGSSVSNSLMIQEVQQKPLLADSTPNPVSLQEAESLTELLMSKMDSVPEWLVDKEQVASAAGNNSIFRLCCLILSDIYSSRTGDEAGAVTSSFSLNQAKEALHVCLGRTDDELKKYASYLNSDRPHLIVPKLCLLVAVMRHTGIKSVYTVKCVGSCAGLLKTQRFWDK